MREAFSQFEWPVAADYEWVERPDGNGRPLIHAESIRLFEVTNAQGAVVDEPDALRSCDMVETAWQRYEEKGKGSGPVLVPVEGRAAMSWRRPMKRASAGLFLKFAGLDYSDRDAIRGFARAYGLLGQPAKSYFGEPHLTWAREICLMREAVKETKRRTPGEDAADRAAWQRYGIEPSHADRRERRTWLFNLHLQHVQARMVFELNAPPNLSFLPLTLLSAMWLQLALAMKDDKEFFECKFCGRIFEISTDEMGFRSHREFCSGSCKTKDYRKRKRTALRLATSGTGLAEISEKAGTSKATIRAWLAATKRQRGSSRAGGK